MPKLTDELAALHSKSVAEQSEEILDWRTKWNLERSRKIKRLARQGVITAGDLIGRLPHLSPGMKQFGIRLISEFKIRQGVPVLLELLSDRAVRVCCADALCWMKSGKKVTRHFVQIGEREMASDTPDRHWLEPVILGGGKDTDDPDVVELLVSIFERVDLPGWIRGDAGDKLGCVDAISDRRTQLFRRCRDAALRGLRDESIDVQFWSMYLIGQLCNRHTPRRRSERSGLEAALPTLRKHAANDHRLAPGYWWPMSAEAEDVIICIKTGHWPDKDAADRWIGNTQRGEWTRD